MAVSLPPVVLAILGAVVVLGVLIFVHELGHFLAAKSVGIAVVRFSFGLGPRTPLRRTIGETEYCLSWLPLGGYVKMAGLEEEGAAGQLEGPPDGGSWPRERTFEGKPLWARVYVIAAGVAMNALFAVVVYAFLAGAFGVREDHTVTVGAVDTTSLPLGASALARVRPGDRVLRINGDTVEGWTDIQTALLTAQAPLIRIELAGRSEPVVLEVPASEQEARLQVARALSPWYDALIGTVVPGGPASRAGVEPGDRIVRADTVTVRQWTDFTRVIEANPLSPVSLLVLRDSGEVALTVTPRGVSVRDSAAAGTRQVGRVDVGLQLPPLRRYGLVAAVGQGFAETGRAGGLILYTLKGLVLHQVSPRDIGGPILVAQISGEMARLGIEPFLSFLALFSVNLAILNLLPIPVLDGGHLLFMAIEAVRRKPLSEQVRQRWTQVGFAVLVAIMLLALANDVVRVVR